MAEEADNALDIEGDGAIAPEVEDLNAEGSPSESEAADKIESLARELGWKPAEEWRGDKTNWTPADEFIRHKVSKSDRLADDVRVVRDQMARMARTSAQITEREVQRAKKEAEERFRQAVEAGDVQAAQEASLEMSRVDSGAASANDDPEVAQFKARNPWFNPTDPDNEASLYALSVAETRARRGASAAEQARAAEEAVRKRFPELFAQEQPIETGKKAPVVNAPQSRAARPAPKAKGYAELPRDAQVAAQDFLRRGRIKSLDDYAKTYWAEEDA